jgi:hypothetical protein
MGPVEGAAGLGDHDPRAFGQQLGGDRHPVEQQGGERLEPLRVQALRDPLQPVAEPVEVAGRSRSRAFGQRVVGTSSRTGDTSTRTTGPVDSCDDGTNSRSDSISSPQNSRRTGRREVRGTRRAPRRGPRTRRGARPRPCARTRARRAARRDRRRKLDPLDQLDRGDLAEGGDEALHRGERGGDQDEGALGRPQPAHGVGSARRDLRRGADPLVREGLPRGQERRPVAPSHARAPRASRSASRGPGATSSTGAPSARASAATSASSPASARALTGRARSSRRRSNASEPISASSA